jgi:hypothetical protein
MTDRSAWRAQRTAEALSYLCAHVEEIRAELRAGPSGDDGPVDRLLSTVLAGGDIETAVQVLHEHIQADGDSRGLYNRTRGPSARVAGVGDAHRPLTVYLCPHRRCTRHEWPEETPGHPPVCGLDGTRLTRKST